MSNQRQGSQESPPTSVGEISLGHILKDGVHVIYHASAKNSGSESAGNPQKSFSKSFRKCLSARKVHGAGFVNSLHKFLAWVTDGVASIPIMLMALVVLTISLGAGVTHGCKQGSWVDLIRFRTACGFSVADVEKLSQSSKAPTPTKERISETKIGGPFFNLPVFQGYLLTLGFILAFSRWQISNREAGMSEVFQRKKEINGLLYDSQSLGKLVSDATAKDKPAAPASQKFSFSHKECLNEIAKMILDYEDGGSDKEAYQQKIFVFMELDNLEFAFTKYRANLLDAEQMYRAFEIFESRCQNTHFRCLAAVQGLKFYTDNFHQVVAAGLMYGHAATMGRQQP